MENNPHLYVFCPFFANTKGHRRICEQVARAIDRMTNTNPLVTICTSIEACESAIKSAMFWDQRGVNVHILVDFPCHGVAALLKRLRGSTVTTTLLGMYHTRLATQVLVELARDHNVIHNLIELEPGVRFTSPAFTQSDMLIYPLGRPLVRVEKYETSEGYGALLRSTDTVLVYATGSGAEPQYMAALAREAFPHAKRVLFSNRLSIPGPAAARMAGQIIAASGYSTMWEFYLAPPPGVIYWTDLNRPVEDCSLRRQVLLEMADSGITPDWGPDFGDEHNDVTTVRLHWILETILRGNGQAYLPDATIVATSRYWDTMSDVVADTVAVRIRSGE
jgi:hypothetical protein